MLGSTFEPVMWGEVTRRLVIERPLHDPNLVEETAPDGRLVAVVAYRVYRRGSMYRTEWAATGQPRRICDGSTVWDFSGADDTPAVRSGGRPLRPFLVDVPPLPASSADVHGLEPLSDELGIFAGEDQEFRRVVYPRASHDARPGYTFLIDPVNGFLRRSWYGDDQVQDVRWSEIRTEQLDVEFTWTGPTQLAD